MTAAAIGPGRPAWPTAAITAFAAAVMLAGFAGCSVAPRRAPSPPAPLARPPPPPVSLDAVPDAVPRFEPRARLGNPPFYEVFGQRYVLLPSTAGYVERGVASWYGPDFHGVATSIGEPYDMYGMTGAHKTLPLPCYVRVTNLRNGRSIVVRINDRGPFVGNRIIDLSYTAALKLDMVRDGTALVEVRSVEPGATYSPRIATTTPPATPLPTAADADAPADPGSSAPVPPTAVALYVQAGAFAAETNALRLVERLHAAGITNAFVGHKRRAERTLFRVRLGPVSSVEEFDQTVARLATLGIPDARLALD